MLEEPGAKFAALLQEHQPKIVAVYEDDFNFLSKMCLTRMREVAWEIAKASKELGAVLIVHGSDSTDNPALFLENGFDYVLCGEAENVLVELCSSILHGAEVPLLDGLVRLDEHGRMVQSSQRLAKNPAWAELLLPARELIDLVPYRAAWIGAHGYFSTNMVSSRGCPFQCNWCAKPISGNRFHLRSAAAVAEEMASLKLAGVGHVWFGDDVFALDRHWVKEFAEEVTKRNAAIPFKVQSRADLMSEQTVRHLKAAGCAEVWMGVESGAQSILDAMNKGLTLSAVVAARDRLKEAGIRACFFLQFGYPGETWTELQETISFVRKARPDDIGISFSYPLPGTDVLRTCEDAARAEAQLGRQRRSLHYVPCCLQDGFLSCSARCTPCRGRLLDGIRWIGTNEHPGRGAVAQGERIGASEPRRRGFSRLRRTLAPSLPPQLCQLSSSLLLGEHSATLCSSFHSCFQTDSGCPAAECCHCLRSSLAMSSLQSQRRWIGLSSLRIPDGGQGWNRVCAAAGTNCSLCALYCRLRMHTSSRRKRQPERRLLSGTSLQGRDGKK